MRLVPSTKCPSIDAELALHACVVLYATKRQLVLLKYSKPFGCWYVCGFRAVGIAPDHRVPEAYYYWRNIGYMEEPNIEYITLSSAPPCSPDRWARLYETIALRVASSAAKKHGA